MTSRGEIWLDASNSNSSTKDRELAELKARVEELEVKLRVYAGPSRTVSPEYPH